MSNEETAEVNTRVDINGYQISTGLDESIVEVIEAVTIFAMKLQTRSDPKNIPEIIEAFRELETRYGVFQQGFHYSIECVAVAIAEAFLESDAAKDNPEQAEEAIRVLVSHKENEEMRRELLGNEAADKLAAETAIGAMDDEGGNGGHDV